MNYYVYIYLDPRRPGRFEYDQYAFSHEPFYIGKGKNGQYISHLNYVHNGNIDEHNPHKSYKIRNIIKESNQDPIILKFRENLSEQEAFDLEIDLIKTIGRKGEMGL